MKISAQEEYGLRCLLQLARQQGDGGWVTVSQIAECEGLSVPYVEKLLRILSRSGLVESARGAKGGYRLGFAPERITVGSALRLLGEFPDPITVCDQYVGNLPSCIHSSGCSVRPVWAQITAYLGSMLDALRLSDLLEGEVAVHQRVTVAHEASIRAKEPLVRLSHIDLNSKTRSVK